MCCRGGVSSVNFSGWLLLGSGTTCRNSLAPDPEGPGCQSTYLGPRGIALSIPRGDGRTAEGTLRAEAGVTLSEIMQRVVPHGFFARDTRYAICNVGWGHRPRRLWYEPSSRWHVRRTVGGLGLTGIIEWAEIGLQRIPSSQLDVEVIPFFALSDFWAVAERWVERHEHTVAWIDCSAQGRQPVADWRTSR